MRNPLLISANMAVAADRRVAERQVHFGVAHREKDDGNLAAVAIVDLSQGGLRAIVQNPPPSGEAVSFVVGERRYDANVVWVRGGVIGCQFVAEIDDEDLDYIVGQAAGVMQRG